MKNDIVGTFAVLVIGAVFLLVARNYGGGQYWLPNTGETVMTNTGTTSAGMAEGEGMIAVAADPNNSGQQSGGKEADQPPASQNLQNQQLVTQAPLPQIIIETQPEKIENIKATKTTEPIPYLRSRILKKYGDQVNTQTLVGGVFQWPVQAVKNEGQVYQYVTGARGFTIESQFDISGDRQSQQRKEITKALRKVGFKQVWKNLVNCQTTEGAGFSACGDYYERGAEKCVSWLVMIPINAVDRQKIEDRLIQIKVWCGKISI